MADTKPKAIKMNTPRGIAKWPKLTAPDYGTAAHPNPEGTYSVKMVFDETDPAFIKFAAKLQPYLDKAEANGEAAFAALKKPQRDKLGAMKLNPLFTPIYDENEEPTGQVELKVAMKASGTVKKGPREGKAWNRKPDIFDSFGRKITKPVEIWGGSELIIGFSVDPEGYFIAGTGVAGIKCALEAVQIVTLRQGGNKSASDYGFGAIEDGYDASTVEDEESDEEDDGFGKDSDEDDNIAGGEKGTADPTGASDF